MQTDANWIAEESLPVRVFAHHRQSLINLSWKSAGSGFESLAPHNSPGHASVLGFFMSVTHHLAKCRRGSNLTHLEGRSADLHLIVTVRHITSLRIPALFPVLQRGRR